MSAVEKIPFLSIIIPTYNAGKTMSIAMESILCQTFKNFEVLVIDGNSTDNTIAVVNKYISIYPNIHIVSEKDKGIYDAMNKGIEKAKGEWLYFIGSDDALFDIHVLQKVNIEMKKKNSHVLYGNVNSSFYGGKYDGEFTCKKLTRLNICHQAIFFHNSIFKRIGYYNRKYNVAADWDHNIKWFFNRNIKRRYIDMIIADFADGGYSWQNEDLLFEKEKNFKLLRAGFHQLSYNQLRRLCKIELERLKNKRNIFKISYLKLYLFVIKVNRKRTGFINSKV